MNYNEAHFPADLIDRLDKKIVMLYQCEELVLESIIEFLKSTGDLEQPGGFTAFIHLIIKMRFNLEAAHKLSPLLKGDYRFKTSVNLMYRSCLDDTINIYYLLGYVLVENDTKKPGMLQPSLNNELDILHREFLKSAIVIIESEAETDRYYSELNDMPYVEPVGTNDWKKELIDANVHLYNADLDSWKNNKEIRSGSSPLFKDAFPPGNGKVPETEKIKFIQNKGFKRCDQLTQLFKYFSQFQHFSPKMHDFLLTTPEFDLGYHHKMLVEMLCVVSECNQILVTEGKAAVRNLLETTLVKLFEMYNNYDV